MAGIRELLILQAEDSYIYAYGANKYDVAADFLKFMAIMTHTTTTPKPYYRNIKFYRHLVEFQNWCEENAPAVMRAVNEYTNRMGSARTPFSASAYEEPEIFDNEENKI